MLLLGVAPVLLVGAAFAVIFGMTALMGKAAVEESGVNWDPVWLGGEMPWGIKIYNNPSPLPKYKGWRVEVLHRGVFCVDKEWTGRRAKYVSQQSVKLWADKWVGAHPEGCPA